MSLCVLPWEVVTRLRMEPIGPIKADVFGLRWTGNAEGWHPTDHDSPQSWEPNAATYHIAEPRRLAQFREALGMWVDSPTGLRRPDKHPFYVALCSIHRSLTEEGT